MKTKIFTSFLFLAAVVGFACNSQNSVNQDNHSTMNHDQMTHSEMKSSPNAANALYDLQFLDTMISHHQGAVVMAKEALQKSQKAEIKTLADSIIKDQEAEIKQMRDWQTAWNK